MTPVSRCTLKKAARKTPSGATPLPLPLSPEQNLGCGMLRFDQVKTHRGGLAAIFCGTSPRTRPGRSHGQFDQCAADALGRYRWPRPAGAFGQVFLAWGGTAATPVPERQISSLFRRVLKLLPLHDREFDGCSPSNRRTLRSNLSQMMGVLYATRQRMG